MKNYNKINSYLTSTWVFVLVVPILVCSCKKMVEVGVPKNAIASDAAFNDVSSAEAAVSGMYAGFIFGNGSLDMAAYCPGTGLLNGLLADEMTYNGTTYNQYQYNSLVANEPEVGAFWSDGYATIYRANAIIEGVKNSGLPTAYQNQATGEALFMRAFCNFYLVNFFGDIPLVTTTNLNTNINSPRIASQVVYDQIIQDLEQAATLLPEAYYPGTSRVRANKWAATALLARVYLYRRNYVNAEAKATAVINASSLYTLPADLSTVFLTSSNEAILGFSSDIYSYTSIGNLTVPSTGVAPNFIMRASLLAAFETNDKRKANWLSTSAGYYFPYKYKLKSGIAGSAEFDVALRLAEQYLIRSEARAWQNNFSGALTDVNAIRTRAGLGTLLLTTQDSLLAAIAQERRVELFSEWGHRWFDLKRTGTADAVISAEKPGYWKPTDTLYPVPSAERLRNINLTQNLGYN